MLGLPVAVDREIAAATLKAHLDTLWASGRPERAGWARIPIDDLHAVIALPSTRSGSGPEPYFLRIGAEYYDAWPVTAVFADPKDWAEASAGSRWIPKIENPPFQFALHVPYGYPSEYKFQQLLCFTGTANYYMVSHSPPEHTVWRKGDRSVSHTIARIAELLVEPYYKGPSGS
jgi:hypothetical protein